MKPIYLKMTAFGSYCDPAEVDFTRLYDNGIFLITGRTGGGKTTILDAMCMALYGKATGSERAREWRQMRCSNAPNSVDTELEYIFSIDNVRYKFYRRWRVPNSRNGEFKVDASENACYSRTDDNSDWTPIATGKASAVNEAAESILKLTHEQFVKVIMLPQGEFRELLTATSDEKEAIFKKLFETYYWEQLSEQVSEEFRRIDQECKIHSNSRDIALKGADCETPEELDKKIDLCRADLKALELLAAQNKAASQIASAELNAAESDSSLFQALREQRSALSELSKNEAEFAEKERRLAISRKMKGLLPEFNLMKAARSTLEQASRTFERAAATEKATSEQLTAAQKSSERLPSLEERKKSSASRLAVLSSLHDNKGRYESAQSALTAANAKLSDEEKRLSLLVESKAQLEKKIDIGNKYLDDCHAATAELVKLNESLSDLSSLLLNLTDYAEKSASKIALQTSLSELQGRIDAEKATLETLNGAVKSAQAAIREDKAYSLAINLGESEPCPVCGSTHHPHPAKPRKAPSAEQLESMEKAAQLSSDALESLRREHSAKSAELEIISGAVQELEAKLGEKRGCSVDEVKTQTERLKSARDEKQKLSSKTGAASEKLRQRNDELVANSRDIECANVNINNLKVQISASAQIVASILSDLQKNDIRDFAHLERLIGECKKEYSALEGEINSINTALTQSASAHAGAQAALNSAAEALEQARKDSAARQAEFAEKCRQYGASENDDIYSRVLPEELEAQYESDATSYRQKLAFSQKRIKELEEQLKDKAEPDLDAFRQKADAALKEGHEIASKIGSATNQLSVLSDASILIRQEDDLLKALEVEYETARRMNRLLSGANEMRTPIQQYVIGIKMDEIIMSANLYMHRLTRGQYSMQRKQYTGGRAKHQGLDIEILDSNAGRVRTVATLSGGEIFLASLSLAFGLSDVVQSFAGGIHLDSLFIDEGFGSLDNETLDTAMDAITQMRGSKLLGIISHISELKERVPCGIEVVKGLRGSSLKLNV